MTTKNISFNIISNNKPSSLKIKDNIISFLKTKKINISKTSKNIIVIGGDGTFINSFKKYANTDAKLLLLNNGGLGFYSIVKNNQYQKIVDCFLNKKQFITPYLINVKSNDLKINEYALNDVFISSTNTLKANIVLDGKVNTSVVGTGLCFSTSFGSSGYNKNLYGSFIPPCLSSCWQWINIAPICSKLNNSFYNSLILSKDQKIDLTIKKINGKCFVNIDGKENFIDNASNTCKISLNLVKAKASIAFDSDFANYFLKLNDIFFKE